MKAYIMKSDKVFDWGQWLTKELVLKDDRWGQLYPLESLLEMNIDDFWISPGKVYVDVDLPFYKHSDWAAISRRYIYKGCTLLICRVPISSKYTMKQEYEDFETQLAGLSIDYMIAPVIQLRMLSPEVIRYFGRKKSPFLLFTIDNETHPFRQKWEWMAQAQTLTHIPIIPFIERTDQKEQKQQYDQWLEVADYYGVDTLPEPITSFPLAKEMLRQTGISPTKGEFFLQRDADYSLYYQKNVPFIEAPTQMSYHKAIPCVTVLRGNVLKLNKQIYEQVGFGRIHHITIPNHLA